MRKELLLVFFVLIPFIYLGIIWSSLPQLVPVHWNLDGKIDRFGNREQLLLIPVLLPFLSSLMLWLIQRAGEGRRLSERVGTFFRLRLIIVFFMSVLATYIIYITENQSAVNTSIVLGLLGLLFAISGNYFPALPQNPYFGIRTPWTLKNETVWKETHHMAGKYWLTGGLIIILSCVFSTKITLIVFLSVTLLLVVVPVIYSFQRYKRLSR